MMNPDITDPNWITQRKQQWLSIEKEWKCEVSRKSLKVIKEYFFGGEFEYSNEEKHGDEIFDNIVIPFFYHPIQTPERWTAFISELDKHRQFHNKPKAKLEIFKFCHDPSLMFNWDLQTAIELQEFVFGDSFIAGDYEFMEVTQPYPLSHYNVVKQFLFYSRKWINGVKSISDDTVACYYFDWFVESMRQLPKIYFETYDSRDRETQIKKCIFNQFLFTLVSSKYANTIMRNRKLTKLGKQNRIEYRDKLLKYFSSDDTSPMFNQTIELLEKGFAEEGEDYEIPRNIYMPEERDVPNPQQ
jgi:hypothetical protein